MKTGTRGCGIAFSDGDETSSCAAAVVRADRVVDGLRFGTCTVGGLDATATVADAVAELDRPDVRYLLVAGVAPAWFNLLDLREIHERTGLPTLSVSFEASEGLEDAIREQFSGEARERRLAGYESLPPRERVDVGDDVLFVRAVGFESGGAGDDSPEDVVRAFTPEGGRPEPLRVARVAARAARTYAAAGEHAVDGERRG